MDDKAYIFYRKLKALCNSFVFYICRIFPIKQNLVSICTFEGKGGFGCNPKYIVKKLYEQNPKLEFIWFVNDFSKKFPNYIKKIPNTLFNRAYWLSRSKIWIDNYRKPYGTRKRKGQFYLNTWHGELGFKTIGLWRKSGFSKIARLVSENDSKMIDAVTISSKWGENVFPRGLLYDGELLMTGSPRCDILYGNLEKARKKFREKHNIPNDAKLIMFAPTYREASKRGMRSIMSEISSIDFKRLLKNLVSKFGGKWYLCFRVHPQLVANINLNINSNINVIDVSLDDDMYEDLAAMDAFITDYSSAAFDASLCRLPVFIYTDDLNVYKNARGDLEWEMSSGKAGDVKTNSGVVPGIEAFLPYPIAENNDELESNILDFNQKLYNEKVEEFERKVSLLFDGKSSERVANIILQKINK